MRRRKKRFEKAAFESVSIAGEVRKRLNTYKFSPVIMENLELEKGWQEKIPNLLIHIIVEQTLLIHKEYKSECERFNRRRNKINSSHTQSLRFPCTDRAVLSHL